MKSYYNNNKMITPQELCSTLSPAMRMHLMQEVYGAHWMNVHMIDARKHQLKKFSAFIEANRANTGFKMAKRGRMIQNRMGGKGKRKVGYYESDSDEDMPYSSSDGEDDVWYDAREEFDELPEETVEQRQYKLVVWLNWMYDYTAGGLATTSAAIKEFVGSSLEGFLTALFNYINEFVSRMHWTQLTDFMQKNAFMNALNEFLNLDTLIRGVNYIKDGNMQQFTQKLFNTVSSIVNALYSIIFPNDTDGISNNKELNLVVEQLRRLAGGVFKQLGVFREYYEYFLASMSELMQWAKNSIIENLQTLCKFVAQTVGGFINNSINYTENKFRSLVSYGLGTALSVAAIYQELESLASSALSNSLDAIQNYVVSFFGEVFTTLRTNTMDAVDELNDEKQSIFDRLLTLPMVQWLRDSGEWAIRKGIDFANSDAGNVIIQILLWGWTIFDFIGRLSTMNIYTMLFYFGTQFMYFVINQAGTKIVTYLREKVSFKLINQLTSSKFLEDITDNSINAAEDMIFNQQLSNEKLTQSYNKVVANKAKLTNSSSLMDRLKLRVALCFAIADVIAFTRAIREFATQFMNPDGQFYDIFGPNLNYLNDLIELEERMVETLEQSPNLKKQEKTPNYKRATRRDNEEEQVLLRWAKLNQQRKQSQQLDIIGNKNKGKEKVTSSEATNAYREKLETDRKLQMARLESIQQGQQFELEMANELVELSKGLSDLTLSDQTNDVFSAVFESLNDKQRQNKLFDLFENNIDLVETAQNVLQMTDSQEKAEKQAIKQAAFDAEVERAARRDANNSQIRQKLADMFIENKLQDQKLQAEITKAVFSERAKQRLDTLKQQFELTNTVEQAALSFNSQWQLAEQKIAADKVKFELETERQTTLLDKKNEQDVALQETKYNKELENAEALITKTREEEDNRTSFAKKLELVQFQVDTFASMLFVGAGLGVLYWWFSGFLSASTIELKPYVNGAKELKRRMGTIIELDERREGDGLFEQIGRKYNNFMKQGIKQWNSNKSFKNALESLPGIDLDDKIYDEFKESIDSLEKARLDERGENRIVFQYPTITQKLQYKFEELTQKVIQQKRTSLLTGILEDSNAESAIQNVVNAMFRMPAISGARAVGVPTGKADDGLIDRAGRGFGGAVGKTMTSAMLTVAKETEAALGTPEFDFVAQNSRQGLSQYYPAAAAALRGDLVENTENIYEATRSYIYFDLLSNNSANTDFVLLQIVTHWVIQALTFTFIMLIVIGVVNLICSWLGATKVSESTTEWMYTWLKYSTAIVLLPLFIPILVSAYVTARNATKLAQKTVAQALSVNFLLLAIIAYLAKTIIATTITATIGTTINNLFAALGLSIKGIGKGVFNLAGKLLDKKDDKKDDGDDGEDDNNGNDGQPQVSGFIDNNTTGNIGQNGSQSQQSSDEIYEQLIRELMTAIRANATVRYISHRRRDFEKDAKEALDETDTFSNCSICGENANAVCPCGQVGYCCGDHQEEHWLIHSESCNA